MITTGQKPIGIIKRRAAKRRTYRKARKQKRWDAANKAAVQQGLASVWPRAVS